MPAAEVLKRKCAKQILEYFRSNSTTVSKYVLYTKHLDKEARLSSVSNRN